MWFKQIYFYPLNTEKLPDLALLADKLNQAQCPPVSGLEWFSEGFVAPHHFSPECVFGADKTWLIALKKTERVLPASVIRECVDAKVAEIQENESRKVGKKEKNELKEQITDDLLPRAFTRSSFVHAVCDTQTGFLLINQSASKKAENLLAKLREALGGLEARLPQTKQSPSSLMTDWLLGGSAQGGFELDNYCEIKGIGENSPVIKFTKQDLTAPEVVQHLKDGKVVTQLGLVWREQIAFVLNEDFTLKRIQYLDVLQEETEQFGDDAPSLAYATQILMAQSITTLLSELISFLGGWQER